MRGPFVQTNTSNGVHLPMPKASCSHLAGAVVRFENSNKIQSDSSRVPLEMAGAVLGFKSICEEPIRSLKFIENKSEAELTTARLGGDAYKRREDAYCALNCFEALGLE